jgi:hypothetical protein
MNSQFKCKNTILLTGAGFTKTFGGWLANEMWARIFGHPAVQGNERVRECMLNQLSFENAYAAIVDTGDYAEQEKTAISEAIQSAFNRMHEPIFSPLTNKTEGIWNAFELFIKRFAGKEDECGFFFTLNQDLCTEFAYANCKATADSKIRHLGIVPRDSWFGNTTPGIIDILDEPPVLLPDQVTIQQIKADFSRENLGNFFYVKLHGSYGWKKKDGSKGWRAAADSIRRLSDAKGEWQRWWRRGTVLFVRRSWSRDILPLS